MEVCGALRKVAETGVTVLTVIHQPRYCIFLSDFFPVCGACTQIEAPVRVCGTLSSPLLHDHQIRDLQALPQSAASWKRRQDCVLGPLGTCAGVFPSHWIRMSTPGQPSGLLHGLHRWSVVSRPSLSSLPWLLVPWMSGTGIDLGTPHLTHYHQSTHTSVNGSLLLLWVVNGGHRRCAPQ